MRWPQSWAKTIEVPLTLRVIAHLRLKPPLNEILRTFCEMPGLRSQAAGAMGTVSWE